MSHRWTDVDYHREIAGHMERTYEQPMVCSPDVYERLINGGFVDPYRAPAPREPRNQRKRRHRRERGR